MTREVQGAVYVEFLIVVMPFLTLFLALTQLGLLYSARILVEHAATKAIRAAIVILPDDAQGAEYAEEALNTVGDGEPGLSSYRNAKDGGRYELIRKAARISLSPLSPPLRMWGQDTLLAAISSDAVQVSAGMELWTDSAVALTFPNGEEVYRSRFLPQERITLEVFLLFPCRVPLARDMMCFSYEWLPQVERDIFELRGGLPVAMGALSGLKFAVLRATRTLPNQGRR